jgi:LacI family transcriptional regulator
MTDSKKKLTQKDVARLAGVSQAIVSHVLNQTDKVIPEETRQRVLQAIKELGYTPNKAARSLRSKRSYNIACIVPDITNAFYPGFLRGIQQVAEGNHYDLIIYDSNKSAAKEIQHLRSLQGGQVDGAIAVLHHKEAKVINDLIESGIHLVTLDAGPPEEKGLNHDVIFVDNITASKQAVTYLLQRGHREIGIIAGTKGTPPQRSRLEGYQQALTGAGLDPLATNIRYGDFTEIGGYAEMSELLDLPNPPTAVFAANDLMAIGALKAALDADLRVPQDVAIMGFDDIPAARLVNPTLTTVTQFDEQIGRKAAALLFERSLGEAPTKPRRVEMPFEIVVRESA